MNERNKFKWIAREEINNFEGVSESYSFHILCWVTSILEIEHALSATPLILIILEIRLELGRST